MTIKSPKRSKQSRIATSDEQESGANTPSGQAMPRSPEFLSRELARIAGLRLRPPKEGEQAHTRAGDLKGLLPEEFFQWRKCPVHGTWLQPATKPFYHWNCGRAMEIIGAHGLVSGYTVCDFKRPAKLRTRIERRIFAVMKFLEDNA